VVDAFTGTMAIHSLHLIKLGYGFDHHFDHHLGLSIEIRLSTKSLFLRETGRMGTSVDTLPVSGGQGLAGSSR
jgi:hypothetical protein